MRISVASRRRAGGRRSLLELVERQVRDHAWPALLLSRMILSVPPITRSIVSRKRTLARDVGSLFCIPHRLAGSARSDRRLPPRSAACSLRRLENALRVALGFVDDAVGVAVGLVLQRHLFVGGVLHGEEGLRGLPAAAWRSGAELREPGCPTCNGRAWPAEASGLLLAICWRCAVRIG